MPLHLRSHQYSLVREALNHLTKVVLLLHGAAFSSQTWIDQVDTMATLAALGNK